jgi:hypothetical protein
MRKEKLLVIPEGAGIAGLMLKPDLTHRQSSGMAVGEDGAGASVMAVEHSHRGLLGRLP